jgi:hypothetical protein
MTRFEKLKLYIESKGGRLLSDSEHWNGGNFIWICENNHQNSSKSQMLYRKSWCRTCITANTKKKVLEKLKENNYTLISQTTSTITYKCTKNHEHTTSNYHVIEGSKCGSCHLEKRKKGLTRLKLQDVQTRLGLLGFTLLSPEYKSLRHQYELKCSKDHIFTKNLVHIIAGVVGCPLCNNSFNSERIFRSKIERIFQVPFPKCRPKWLVNPETNYKLELDCYNEELKLAFEYDGQFHFEVRKGLNNDLDRVKKLDALKERLCVENDVTLIRIPYFLKSKEFYEKIIHSMKIIYGVNYHRIIKAMEFGTITKNDILELRIQ